MGQHSNIQTTIMVSSTKYLRQQGIDPEGMSVSERWRTKRASRPGVIYRSGNKLGGALGRRAGKANVKSLLSGKNGVKSGFVPAATRSFVENNPKTVAGAGIVTAMGVMGFVHLGYQITKKAVP